MAQVKIYGLDRHLQHNREKISTAIHHAVVETLSFPPEKKFHRFIALEKEFMLFPEDKSAAYTIIEILMIAGRSVEVKKRLIKKIFEGLEGIGISNSDVEIVILESPASNWGFRGECGDEITLGYKVKI